MKYNRILVAFVFLFITNSSIAQVWRTATPYVGPMNDIVFPNVLTGYACGSGPGIGNCTASAFFGKTIDGGKTWTRMNSNTTNTINRLFFKDAFTGWSVGNSSNVMKTTDGGVTWVQQTSGIGSGLNDVFFADYNTGFICGPNGALRKTTNGGTNFTTIASGVTTTLYGVYFVNTSIGYIVGDNGVIRKTINGGSSFFNVYIGSEGFRDVQFVNDTVGFVMSYNKILKTSDGGSHWQIYNADPSWIMTRMHFVSSRVGYVYGDSGLLLKTTDGGDTWNVLNTNTTTFIRSVYFTDENTGYYGRDLGRIYKTMDGGNSWNSVLSGYADELMSVRFRNRALGISVGKYGSIFRTANGGLNWTYRDLPTVSFLNCVRWITDEKAIAVGASGSVIKSDDAGLHWHLLNPGVTEDVYDIHVVDSSTFYLTYGIGKLMKTLDGGASWDTTLNTTSTYSLTGVYFLNKDTGYTCASSMEIYRTYNGGATWTLKNDSVQQFTTFNDIFFSSKDTGYVAGTFGKLYRTINGGEWWHAMYPPSTSNAEINEIQFVSNDTGYFAGSVSQRATYNAGEFYNVLPTYCLANNGESHSISIPENGYGYCVGGILHTTQKDSMLATYLQDSIFCAGSKIFVGYLASGFVGSTQVLDVQLSDVNGSFASPTIIGTFQLVSPTSDPSGIATCMLPVGLNGTGYRIRVVCNSPSKISPDNGYDLTINSIISPDVNLSLMNSTRCFLDTLRFAAQVTGGGSDPAFSWQLDHQPVEWEAGILPVDTLVGLHSVSVTVTSGLTCAPSTATDSITVFVNPRPSINITGNSQVCLGDSVMLTANSSLPTPGVTWSPSDILNTNSGSSVYVKPSVNTTVYATIADDSLCTNTDSISIALFPVPVTPIITLVNNAIVITDNMENLIWYKDGNEIIGFSNDTLYNAANGNYYVTTTDANGCSAISQSLVVDPLGMENSDHGFSVRVYPNPVYDMTAIYFSGNLKSSINLTILNLLGDVVFRKNITSENQQMDLSFLPQGSYLLELKSKYFVVLKKLIKL